MNTLLFFILLLALLVFILLIFLLIKLRKTYKSPLILSIIFGLYAFIPIIGAVLYQGTFGGDPGPFSLLLFPPLLPLFGTFYIFASIISQIYHVVGISLSDEISFPIASFINLLLWTAIGYLIGILIKRGKKEKNRGARK